MLLIKYCLGIEGTSGRSLGGSWVLQGLYPPPYVSFPYIVTLISKAISFRSSIFSTNIGKIVYPSYEICRQTAIFKDRDDVINYDLASQDLYHMEDEIDHKNFDEARKIYYKIYPQFVEALKKLASGDPRLIYVRFLYLCSIIFY